MCARFAHSASFCRSSGRSGVDFFNGHKVCHKTDAVHRVVGQSGRVHQGSASQVAALRAAPVTAQQLLGWLVVEAPGGAGEALGLQMAFKMGLFGESVCVCGGGSI